MDIGIINILHLEKCHYNESSKAKILLVICDNHLVCPENYYLLLLLDYLCHLLGYPKHKQKMVHIKN